MHNFQEDLLGREDLVWSSKRGWYYCEYFCDAFLKRTITLAVKMVRWSRTDKTMTKNWRLKDECIFARAALSTSDNTSSRCFPIAAHQNLFHRLTASTWDARAGPFSASPLFRLMDGMAFGDDLSYLSARNRKVQRVQKVNIPTYMLPPTAFTIPWWILSGRQSWDSHQEGWIQHKPPSKIVIFFLLVAIRNGWETEMAFEPLTLITAASIEL